MPKKRKSRGRSKGDKGRSGYVECTICGQRIPRDKAKKITKYVSLVDPALARELRKSGAYIPRIKVEKYYCVSCAVHHKVVKVRSRDERKVIPRRRMIL
ncbi:30S ribosomal protein S26e [Candidatus Bathyarchaeota archaeon ex4484_205]|nr:MAG: 30S ribosomal protein S26e [Candidatus Bathyarchaeota archaeon ex4484_205]